MEHFLLDAHKAQESAYCLINLDHIIREDDPLLPSLPEIEDPLLDSDSGFQQTVQGLINEEMGEAVAEGQLPQGEGTSTSAHRSGKEPAHIVSSDKGSSTIVSSHSHGEGDGGDGRDNGTGGTNEYYQHDDKEAVLVEDVHEFPKTERFDPNHSYQQRRKVSPPGNSNEQGNIGGDVGGEQAASWNPCYNEPYSNSWPHPQGP